MRDLASIVTIKTKNKMYQKDKICVVTFNENAYEAIVPIECNIGDKMVFIQEGSILPVLPKWEYLRKRCYKEELNGFLIRPMIMGAKDSNGEKGDRVKSWGLCVSLTEAEVDPTLDPGADVTDTLGIKKYEPDVLDRSPTKQNKPKFIQFCFDHRGFRWIGKLWLKFMGKQKEVLAFPTDIIQKSDETTIQNCPSIIEEFPGKSAFITSKMEGQSFTCSLDLKHRRKFYICSRNNRFKKPDSSSSIFFLAAEKYDIANKLEQYYKEHKVVLIIQGEQCGPGIQGNIYNFREPRWFVFRMKGYENSEWVEYNFDKMSDVCKELGLYTVPLIKYVEDMGKEFPTVDSLVNFAEKLYWTPGNYNYKPKKKDVLWSNYLQHEGMVVKSTDYNKEKNTGFSFKVKNMEYQEKLYTEMNKIAKSITDNKNK